MFIRVENTFINTCNLVSAQVDKTKIKVQMVCGENYEFDGANSEYLRTILDAAAYTDVRILNDKLPQVKKPAQEF